MKSEYQIYVKDPSSLTQDEKELTSILTNLITKRFNESRSLSMQDGIVNIGIFFNRPEIPNDFLPINSFLYYKNEFYSQPNDWIAFEITLKAGLKKIEHRSTINNVALVFSDKKVTEEDYFAINRTSSVKPSYKAIDPIYKLEDVVMNENERDSIYRALTIISERDLIFNKWGFSHIDKHTKSILCFHGEAGTGKTMCAHAIASHLHKKILIGSYSQIQSKYVGDGEKNLVAYFKAAEEQDAVLFIDEADTFLSRRLPSSNENSKHYNSMSNELYTLIENFNGCIVFASNHIKDFDPAVISRIIEPIEFKLPDDNARKQIIKKMIPNELPLKLNTEQLNELSKKAKGFSGRDIRKAMLLFISSSAYKYKVKEKKNENEITLVFDDIYSAFDHVKKNKDILQSKVNGINVTSRIIENSKRNTRFLQVAALALWADGKITKNEHILFDELSSKFGGNIDIDDKLNLPTLSELCNTILSKTEKVQMLDIAARVVSVDGEYSDEEVKFIHQLSTLLGLNPDKQQLLDTYINNLVKENTEWNNIVSFFRSSEYELLHFLKNEFSDGAAWYQLGLAYKLGNKINGENISINSVRSQECFSKALDLGYEKAKSEIIKD